MQMRPDPPGILDRARGFLRGIGSMVRGEPEVGSRERPATSPAVHARAPEPALPGWDEDVSPALQRELDGPFVQDTLKPWLGVDPKVGSMSPFAGGDLVSGAVHQRQPSRVGISTFAQEGRLPQPMDEVLTHEFAHSAGMTPGNPISAIGKVYSDSVGPMKLGAQRLAFTRGGADPEEARAYAVQAAMQAIREKRPKEHPANDRARKENPGFDAAYDWLISRAQRGNR